jgi:hypothetical protein
MGQIVKFPIIVIDDKVSEERIGITPKLRDSVRAPDIASREAVVSEAGIRKSIIENVNASTCAANLIPSGHEYVPIFDSISSFSTSGSGFLPSGGITGAVSGNCGNLLRYNSIQGIGNITTSSDENTIYIDAVNDITSGITVVINKTINGGIEQEASKINYSDFDATSGVGLSGFTRFTAFKDPKVGDAIGKILIKCTEAFDDETTFFSIGTVNDPEYYVKTFKAPNLLVSGGI